jgi:hypothetical protein
MPFSEFELKRLEMVVGAFVQKHRPAPHIRPQLDLAFRIAGQSVEIYEIRPRWQGNSEEAIEHPVAKATYVKFWEEWRIYWMRADLKWHRYLPKPEVKAIDKFLSLVGEDKHGCFFG